MSDESTKQRVERMVLGIKSYLGITLEKGHQTYIYNELTDGVTTIVEANGIDIRDMSRDELIKQAQKESYLRWKQQ